MHRQWIPILLALILVTLAGCGQVDDSIPDLPNTRAVTSTNTSTTTPTNIPTSTPPATKSHTTSQLQTALTTEDCSIAGLPEIACTGVSANDKWVPVIQDFNGVEMALVPAGCFQMGNDNGFPEERPVHKICINQHFWIDRTEVTVSQFVKFLNTQPDSTDSHERWLIVQTINADLHTQLAQDGLTWHPLPSFEQLPIENTTWFGATEYCAWREARLPTESEWEYTARGPNNYLYPWGNERVSENVVRFRGKNPEVGSIPQGASWVGALDMSGSVFEWTSSIYQPYPYDATDGREAGMEIDSFSHRVLRGSAWYHTEGVDNVSATARFDAPPSVGIWYYGFRCARPLER